MQTSQNSCFLNFTNDTVFRKTDWGPRRDPLYIVIPISIIYVSIFITGVLGNISTCVVIASNKCMHTATNYYLFSLAISDLLLLVAGLPPEIYYIWSKYPYIFGEEFCVLQGFAAEASANATVLTITAFTVERYVAICYPFFSHTLSKLTRAVKYIIYIWVFALCLAVPQALVFGIVCEMFNGNVVEDHCVCVPKRSVVPHAFEISTVLFFIAPMSLISVLYMLIGVQLHKSIRPARDNDLKLRENTYKPVGNLAVNNIQYEREKMRRYNNSAAYYGRNTCTKNAHAARHVIKMLVAVVVAFFICWAPFHAQRLLAIYGTPTSRSMQKAFQILTYVSGIFYYLSTTVNPLLYHIMSHKYRAAFKATYRKCCKKHQNVPEYRCYSSISARSSQVNSHSTDSYSHPAYRSTLRKLEQEMSHLRDNKRPLVVSFKRQKCPEVDNCTNYKLELREKLDCLRNDHLSYSRTSRTIFETSRSENYISETDILQSNRDSYACTSKSQLDVTSPLNYDSPVEKALDLLRNSNAISLQSGFELNSYTSNLDSCNNYETNIYTSDSFGTDFERQAYLEVNKSCSFMEVHTLQPTHICPLNRNVSFL